MADGHDEHESLVTTLNDDAALASYRAPYDNYRPSLLPRLLGGLLVGSGTLVYGRKPSYQKFRAIEVIARVPYHSWTSALFTLLTLFYSNEERALRLSRMTRFTHFAAENETMHVVVVSGLANAHERGGIFRHSIIPVLVALFYFWLSYLLYLISPRWSLEINYMFEAHAFEQYSEFIAAHGEELKKCSMQNAYLDWYGRHPRTEYEFFRSLRNDELVHRNRSIEQIALYKKAV